MGMRSLYVLALVCAGVACGQTPVTRTVRLANIGNPQGLEVAATVLRIVCDMKTVAIDAPTSSITFTDTPDTVALAEWTLTAIDVAGPMAAQEYRVPGPKDDV